jgi:hypothetical protein
MKSTVFGIVLIFNCVFFAASQTSNGTGDWQSDDPWIPQPPIVISNSYGFGAIDISLNDSVWLNSKLQVDNNKNFELNVYGKLTLDALDAKNDLIINVYGYGLLTIVNDVEVNNGLKVSVYEGGVFNVGGKIQLKNTAKLEINGHLSAEIISGGNNNDLTGSGSIYLLYPATGINLSGFTGNLVFGDTDLSLPVPHSLSATVLTGPQVQLTWEYEPAADFIGFQIYRNNDPAQPSYLAEVIGSPVIYYSNKSIAISLFGNTLSFLDENLSNQDKPKYYIRAVYNIGDSVIKYSAISNVVNFNDSPLPIELLSFEARLQGNAVSLQWVTASEINNDYFTIEKSTNLFDWSILGFVDGAGTTNLKQHYNFTDNASIKGVAYYRLKQTDLDGAFEYFNPLAINVVSLVNEENLKIIRSSDRISVIVPEQRSGKLEMYDMQGRLVFFGISAGTVDIPVDRGSFIVRFSDGIIATSTKVVL